MGIKSSSANLDPAKIHKIGILRSNALGDFIVTLPAITSLKHYFPNAELVLFGREWHKIFLEETDTRGFRRTPIDRVIVIPILKGLREEEDKEENPEEIEEFFRTITFEKFDLTISFQGNGISAIPFLKRINADYSFGLSCNESDQADSNLNFYYYQSEVMRYLETSLLTGASIHTVEPHINLLDKDLVEAKNYLESTGINQQFVAMHPCSKDQRRMWTKEKFAFLANLFHNEGLKIILTGSFDEELYNDEIIKMSDINVVNSSGKLSLGGLAALYYLSNVTVSVDTGTLHLAIAAQANTVGLYWAPNVINWAPLFRNNHRPVISWEVKCPHCEIIPVNPYPFEPKSNTCNHPSSFIESITVEEVYQAASNFIF